MVSLRLALAQCNPTVGALRENRELLQRFLVEAKRLAARIVLFPELVLSGYPPEDLISSPGFVDAVASELEALLPETRGLVAVIGLPLRHQGAVMNGAALLCDGRWVDSYYKCTLPNYGVFDEKRYFRPGLRCPVYQMGGLAFGLNICEDLWAPRGVPAVQARGGARLLLNISSSPYYAAKGEERETLLRHRARQHGAAIAYVNLVGGQDELVFDGDSLVVDAAGEVRARSPQFREHLLVVDLEPSWLNAEGGAPTPFHEPVAEPIDELEDQFFLETVMLDSILDSPSSDSSLDPLSDPSLGSDSSHIPPVASENTGVSKRFPEDAEIYHALCLGVRDYVNKNGFRDVLIGLSGGIDSALTAALAADALGKERVCGVTMPSRFNSLSGREGARRLAENLGIRFYEIPIDAIYQSYLELLAPVLAGERRDVTEENIQARIRGNLLMALSNNWGSLVLTTGNKSEMAVGYCTLYGDMAGGFAVIKDVPKTVVYQLARYRNSIRPVIPEDTLTRPPSAELREGQCDQDSLPPYEVLDPVVEARMEREENPSHLVAAGFDPQMIETIYRWIDVNEYKRRQAPPGIKITPRAFGRDRRYPITNRYRWSPAPPPG